MRNIAKCKLCSSIIESFHENDYVSCSCGEISVDGGESLRCSAKDFSNFLRVDDQGNEIVVKVQEKNPVTKDNLLRELEEFIDKIDQLPSNLMYAPINHFDLCSALLLIHAILKSKD